MINSISLLCAGNGFNWYGFLIGMAMVVAIILAYFMSIKRGYYKDVIFDIAIICIPLAIIGARLYYVIFDTIGTGRIWSFTEILGFDSGGLAGLSIFGGLIGALLGAVIIHFWKRKKPEKNKITFMQMADLCFGVILLAQAIGRWGNFANQEAYGPKVDWNIFPFSVYIDQGHAINHVAGYYMATFFYESMWNLIGAGILLWLYNGRRKSFDGFIFSVYCIFYGLGRTVIESLRQDPLMAGNVRVSQLTAILFALFGVFYIAWYIYKAKSKNMKLFIFVDSGKLDESYYGYKECILHHPNIYPKKGKAAQDLEDDTIDDFYDTPSDDFYNTGEQTDDFYANNSSSENNLSADEILKSVNDVVSETVAKNSNDQNEQPQVIENAIVEENPKETEVIQDTNSEVVEAVKKTPSVAKPKSTTTPKSTTATKPKSTTTPKSTTATKPKSTTTPKSTTATKPKRTTVAKSKDINEDKE